MISGPVESNQHYVNAAALIVGVFILDYGVDKFLDHAMIVGQLGSG